MRDESGRTLGDGAALPWTIPVGAAGTAAYGVLEPPGFEYVNCWTGITNTIVWHRASRSDETLIAHCRLAGLGRTSARLPYRVVSATRGDEIVEGEFVFVSITLDGPAPYIVEPRAEPMAPPPSTENAEGATLSAMIDDGNASRAIDRDAPATPDAPPLRSNADPALSSFNGTNRSETLRRPSHPIAGLDELWTRDAPDYREPVEPPAPDLFGLHPPIVESRTGDGAGSVWTWRFPNGLFRVLAHPLAGHSEPLGRRLHPYGRILEGMGVHAALVMAGGGAPREASVRWSAPVRGDANFRIESTIEQSAANGITVAHRICEGERDVGAVRVHVAR